MKRTRLSEEELEVLHTSRSNGKERDRIKAVLLRSEGWTVPMISQALRRHQNTIIRHLDDYRTGKLTLSSGGSDSHLSDKQAEALTQHLEEQTYHYVHDIISYVSAK